jgi:hypothetical protein
MSITPLHLIPDIYTRGSVYTPSTNVATEAALIINDRDATFVRYDEATQGHLA